MQLREFFQMLEDNIPASGPGRVVSLILIVSSAFMLMLSVLAPLGNYAQSRVVQARLAKDAATRRKLRDDKRAAAVIDIGSVPKDMQAAILDMTATQLLAALHDTSNAITAVAAMTTLAHRSRLVGEALDCNAEEFFAEGIAAAGLADSRIAAGTARPLEGLPFSVKDCLHMAGAVATCGTAALAMKVSDTDAAVVGALRDQGAIPFVRGNVPQCLMLPESVNAIWGRALNPWDTSRTPGGSSGGDAALVAARCTPLAIGTDIGGSIRNPATFCGVVGFKPSATRLSHKGFAVPRKHGYNGQESVLSTAGPIARSVEDCALFMRAATTKAAAALDPLTLCRPWDESEWAGGAPPPKGDHPLRVGFYVTDDFFFACPTAQRAVREAVAALEGVKGVEMVPIAWRKGLMRDLATAFFAIMSADGGMQEFKGGLGGEALHEMYSTLYLMANIPNALRPAISAVLRTMGEPRPAGLLAATGGKTTAELWDWVGRRGVLKGEVLRTMSRLGLDAFISPSFGVPALKHGLSAKLNVAAAYNFIYNLLDMPAGVLPVTRVGADEDRYLAVPGQQDRYAKVAKENAVGSAGVPMGVQVVGRPHADETVLRVMSILESALPEDTAHLRGAPSVSGVDE